MEHTKETWNYDHEYTIEMEPTGLYEVFQDGDDNVICVATKDNARRIVACVNACEGYDTETLEKHMTPISNNLEGFALSINKLTRKNARLFEATQKLVAHFRTQYPLALGEPLGALIFEAETALRDPQQFIETIIDPDELAEAWLKLNKR